jgi:hypothetical protein
MPLAFSMKHPKIPLFEFLEAPAPPQNPMAHYERSETHVTLGIPRLGSIQVTHHSITVMAPDFQKCEDIRDRIGEWAQAQWYAAQGYRVMRGAAVGIHDTAVVILGDQRCGASSLAYCLSQRGWGLISDGLVIIDDAGIVQATADAVTLDANSAIAETPGASRTKLKTARGRIRIETNGHAEASIGHYVFVGVSRREGDLILNPISFDSSTELALESLRFQPLLTPTKSVAPISPGKAWLMARPLAGVDLTPFMPPELAAALMVTLTERLV